MNDLQVFGFEGRNVRVVEKDGSPWWVAKDVCEILDLDQVTRAVERLDDDERALLKVTHPQSPSTEIEVNAVSESGLYSLIIRSDKPDAKRFRKWITSEVLPSIRKNGSYGIPKIQKAPSPMLVSSVNRSVTLGIIPKETAAAMILADCTEKHKAPKSGASVQTPALSASTIRPLFAFFDHTEFAGWRMALESNPHHFERLGVALRTRRGNPELLIQHDHRVLTKVCGKDYKIALRDDPAYIGTIQAHIARNQVSCLVFDWRRV